MKNIKTLPPAFEQLIKSKVVCESDLKHTQDGFFTVYKSLSDILAANKIFDFFDLEGQKQPCNKFFDDWYLYAVCYENKFVYSLFKLREQEHDAQGDAPADGDTPGVTISFIEFCVNDFINCIKFPTKENLTIINNEINRVVAYKRQHHNKVLKDYFLNPKSIGAYLVAELYVSHISSFAKNGYIETPLHYKAIVQQSISNKNSVKLTRIPSFIALLNNISKTTVCDNEKIYIANNKSLSDFECAAILATHTGNVSFHSFAAEVEYHAKFLTPFAKIKIPFFGKSIYESAIRADMTIDDNEFEGPAPFYKLNSKIVKRQQKLHQHYKILK